MGNLIFGGENLIKTAISNAKNFSKDMSKQSMIKKIEGNPILGNNSKMIEQFNPINLFKQNFPKFKKSFGEE